MLYAASFLISAVVFSLLARAETEPWARDDAHKEEVTSDPEAGKELLEMNRAGVVPENPVA